MQTQLTVRYSTMTPTTPINMPRGRSRCGLRISPLTKLAVCQPPYAKITGTIAVASPERAPPTVPATSSPALPRAADVNPTTINIKIAAIFVSISALCTLLPARTPSELTIASDPSVTAASSCVEMPQPVRRWKYSPKMIAARRHAAGLHDEQQRPSIERRRRSGDTRRGDTRIVRRRAGEVRASSAYTNAPTSAIAPPIAQAHSARSAEWTRRATSLGIAEDPAADDAAHHDHRGVEHAEAARECGLAGNGVSVGLCHGALNLGGKAAER
jgi:hypothetical protein